jgi:DNA polymerase-3 subunit alpha
MNKTYTPLHCHSHYSLLDGFSKPADMASRTEEIGAVGCALTDHGSISGTMQFSKALKKKGLKPVLGCELYISSESATMKEDLNRKLHHLPILAKNKKGWQSLVKLISWSNRKDHFYYKPRVGTEELAQFLDGNLIGFSGHLGSDMAIAVMPRDKNGNNVVNPDWKNNATRLAKWYEEIFGKGNFFIEIQRMDRILNPAMKTVADMLTEVAKITGIPTLATPDAHYCRHEDAVDQRVLLCTNMKTTFAAANQPDFPLHGFFKSDNYHIPTYDEMISYGNTEEELDNTNLILSQVEEYSIESPPRLPPFLCPAGFTEDSWLKELCRKGWEKKIKGNSRIRPEDHQVYVDRVKKEMDVLQGAGLSSYFLIVADIVNKVRGAGYLPGPGRGSAAGSLVSYLLGITSINPIFYGLIFERFYNDGRNAPGRISMPDIDVDVPVGYRDRCIADIKNDYGHDKVGQMITFQTMKGRGAIKDVLRAYGGYSYEEMNRITKFIPDEARIADELATMDNPSILRWALENNAKDLMEWCYLDDKDQLAGPLASRFEQAIRLEGTKTNQSKHAAGIVVSPVPLEEVCPMLHDSKSDTGDQICGFEMFDAEAAGLLKLDILGVAVLDKVMGVAKVLRGESLCA